MTAADPRDVLPKFVDWLAHEMPAGTVIGDPKWWAPRIARAYESALAHARPEAVDEAMVRRSLDAQPFFYSRNQGARVWQLFLDERDSEEIVREILTAALTPERAP